MNIVFTGTFALAPKGTMRVRALPLAQALSRRGHRVTLVLPPWDNPAQSGVVQQEESVTVINIPLPRRLPLVWYGHLTWRLLRQIKALQPEVLHAFKPKGFSGLVAQALLAQRAAGFARTRVVVDTDDWEGAGGWNDREPYPLWQRACFDYQESWLLRHADAVTAASRTLVDRTVQMRSSSAKVFYVPNGSACSAPVLQDEATGSLRRSLGLNGGPVVLLYTRFVEFAPERAVLLLQAIAERGHHPKVLLVGAGLHGEEQVFLNRAEAQGLPLTIVNAGWVDQEALPQYFALADVALFPMDDTLINQAKCSVKLVDLLSAGVPVVAEGVGQCQEYIQDGATGLLVRPGDHLSFANAVVTLLQNPDQRNRMGRAARERMASEYTWDRLSTQFEEAYRA